ncbi:MAG: Flp pilus assembly protein CpaB [Anaerolineae bacterium]
MGRLRGCLWLTAGLVIAVAAAVVAYITITNAIVQSTKLEGPIPKVGVVVTTRVMAVRTLITAADVELKQVSVDTAPDGALRKVEEAINRVTTVDLYTGEVLVASRLVNPTSITGDGRTAILMEEEQVLVAFPTGDLMSRIGVLKPGDHIDILVTFDFPVSAVGSIVGGGTQQGSSRVTFVLLQNLTIAAIVGGEQPPAAQSGGGLLGGGGTTTVVTAPSNPDALLLTVSPQDALVLKYLKDNGTVFDIALRAPGVEKAFTTVPVDMQWIIDRYSIPLEGTGQ